jgi:hypothetical protein
MTNQIGNIVGCYAIDENGTKINFGKISNITFEQNTNYCDDLCCHSIPISRNGTFTLEVEPDENGTFFTVEVPQKEKKGEKELNGTIIYCRFETAKGKFNEHTKTYAFYVAASPEDSVIKKGTIFQVWNMDKKIPEYNGARLQCDEIVGVEDKIDADVLENKTLKTIERIKIAGEIVSTNKKYVIPRILNKIEDSTIKTVGTECVGFTLGDGEIGFTLGEDIVNASKGIISFSDDKIDDTIYAYGCDENTNILGGNDMNTNMFGNVFKNMKFGKIETIDIKYSIKGIAFRTTDGDYVCYNPDFTFTNVADMVMDMPMFAMPVSKDQIKVGDVIKHNNVWVIVNEITPSEIKVAKPLTREIASVIPETSIFGFSFYTKIMNPFENLGTSATADNPFGNILPFMLMSGGDTKNSNDNLMMMLAFGGEKVDFNNPMMMYMLMSENSNTNDMLMMMMLNGNNPFEQKKECNCNCKCEYTVIPQANSDVWVSVDDSIDAKAIGIDLNYKEK